tara:strand:- start:535 stop:1212 length:678 start_codon:yes stop_codon:yes gene_type:complete
MREVAWTVSSGLTNYSDSLKQMKKRVELIQSGKAIEQIWLLQHPPLYTAGTSAKAGDLIVGDRFPVFETGRGGQYTYHGPGQRVIYLMLDLHNYRQDVRMYISLLERWLINTLSHLDVNATRMDDRVGIWVPIGQVGNKTKYEKIGAIGVRIRRWITSHGVSLNISPNLEHFSGIVPCGINDSGVTSLEKLKRETDIAKIDKLLKKEFLNVFRSQNSLALVEEAC